MALQGYRAISLFPSQVSDCDYHHAVLDHVFKPNEEDHHDASGWVQDVDSIVAYLERSTDSVSTKFFKSIANESKLNKIKNFVHAVQGSGRDVSLVLVATNKMKTACESKQKSDLGSKFKELAECPIQKQTVFTKSDDELICSPLFFYNSSGAFLKALEEQLQDSSWVTVGKNSNSPPFLNREGAEALVKANIRIAPAYLYNLYCFHGLEFKEFIEKLNPLQLAILRGDLKEIDDLVKVPEYRTSLFSCTTLGLAILSGNLDVVKALVHSAKFDLEEKDSEQYSPVKIASVTGHLPILKFLLEKGAKPDFSRNTHHLLGTKLLIEKGAEIPAIQWHTLRSRNKPMGRRLQKQFIDSISRGAISEVNERLNTCFLSHAWHKKGEVEIKRKDRAAAIKMELEGSGPEVNCEIMSRIWREFCQSHPRDIPTDFEALLGDALMCAAESNGNAEGLFERYEKGDLTIFPVSFEYSSEESHAVGVLLLKDYLCIFNGGIGRKNGALFHGRFQSNSMTEEIIKKMRASKDLAEYEQFFYVELPKLIHLKKDKDESFLNCLFDYFGLSAQGVGNCGWFNVNHLVPIAISHHLYENRDEKKVAQEKYGEHREIHRILTIARDVSDELDTFSQAWLLRNYLFSETRQDYDLCHDFIKNILKSSWALWLEKRSQVTKNILYACEKRYLDLLSEEDRSIYKADKVVCLFKAWEGRTLYPSIFMDDLKERRLR